MVTLLKDPEIQGLELLGETGKPPDEKKRKTRSRSTSRSSTSMGRRDHSAGDVPPPINLTVGDDRRTGTTLPFYELRKEKHYIDKTELIADIHDEEAKGLYLCYPRQTGKSTVVDSYIQWSVHNPETREKRLSLFENTKIMRLATEKMTSDQDTSSAEDQSSSSMVKLKDGVYGFNQHMILNADFACIQENNIEDLKCGVIREFLSSLMALYKIQLLPTREEEFLKKNPTSIGFFYDLLRLVKENKFGAETAVVIINNFDAPVLCELNRTRSRS